MCIFGEIIHHNQLIDPRTRRVVAAYGEIKTNANLPGKYWVSIEDRPIEFFRSKDIAQQFYEIAVEAFKMDLFAYREKAGRNVHKKPAHVAGK